MIDDEIVPAEHVHDPSPATRDDLLLVHTPDYVDRFTAGALTHDEERRLGLPLVAGSRRTIVPRGRRHARGGGPRARRRHRDEPRRRNAPRVSVARRRVLRLQRRRRRGARAPARRTHRARRDRRSRRASGQRHARDLRRRRSRVHVQHARRDGTTRSTKSPARSTSSSTTTPATTNTSTLLADALPRVLDRAAPDLVVYLAGADPYAGDRLGRLSLTFGRTRPTRHVRARAVPRGRASGRRHDRRRLRRADRRHRRDPRDDGAHRRVVRERAVAARARRSDGDSDAWLRFRRRDASGFTTHDAGAALLGRVRPAGRAAACSSCTAARRAPRLSPAATARARRRLSADLLRSAGRRPVEDRPTGPPITWQTHVADLDAVIQEFSLDPATIVGYSWGGLLAMLFAIESAAARTTSHVGEARAPRPGAGQPRSIAGSSKPSSHAGRTAEYGDEASRGSGGERAARSAIPTRIASGRSS